MTRIKVCGITRPQDAVTAAQLGVDAMGLVFYPSSPRYVTIEQAKAVIEAVPPFMNIVGLFVDAGSAAVAQHLAELAIDTLQFHGNESPDDCCWSGKRVIKAIRVRSGMDLAREIQRYTAVDAVLLDAYQKGVPGGTGQTFDWSAIPQDCGKPVILAGGLNASNVAEAIQQVNPSAVDTSGGVEVAKGHKDAQKMAAFITVVRSLKRI